MIDTGRCKMVWEDNEEEYEEFYDYAEGEAPEGKEIVMNEMEGEATAMPSGELYLYGPGEKSKVRQGRL